MDVESVMRLKKWNNTMERSVKLNMYDENNTSRKVAATYYSRGSMT